MSYTVDDHFTGKEPVVRDLYAALLAAIRKYGPLEEDPKKTSIHLVNRTAMAGVYTRREYINLDFKSEYPIDSPRIARSEQLSRNRYHHTIKLTSKKDLDRELLGWLKNAYTLSA
jgi:hypothetical protein